MGDDMSPWISYGLTIAYAAVLVFLPGWLVTFGSIKKPLLQIASAAPAALALYAIVALVFGAASIPANCVTAPVAVLLISILIFIVSRQMGYKTHYTKQDIKTISIYILCALLITGVFFILPLDGPSSFSQHHDNVHHLNQIRYFLTYETGVPIFDINSMLESSLAPVSGASFYPSTWHFWAALVAGFVGGNVVYAETSTLFVSMALIFPFGCAALIDKLYSQDRVALISGGFLSMAFCAFPWHTFAYSGPLYPYLVGMICVPAALSLLLEIGSCITGKTVLPIRFLFTALLVIFACVSIHASVIFSLGVLIAPYLVYLVYRLGRDRLSSHLDSMGLCLAVVSILLIAAVWLICFKLPFLSSTVNFFWPKVSTVHQGIIDVLTLAFMTDSAQVLLSIFMLFGAVDAIRSKENRWLIVSFCFSGFLFIVSHCTDLPIKNVLTGFWYTDWGRIAPIAVIAAIPIATHGLSILITRLASHCFHPGFEIGFRNQVSTNICWLLGVNCIIALILFYPSFSLKGCADITTGFGYVDSLARDTFDSSKINFLDSAEQNFLKTVAQITSGNDIIINLPDDGSFFAYGLYGLNTYYKGTQVQFADNESETSKEIRYGLNDIANNLDLQERLRKLNARYILLLDEGGARDEEHPFYLYYDPTDWSGLLSIKEDTPGFTLLLSEGDMRLYQIDSVAYE